LLALHHDARTIPHRSIRSLDLCPHTHAPYHAQNIFLVEQNMRRTRNHAATDELEVRYRVLWLNAGFPSRPEAVWQTEFGME
jgi:hypothetical protein